jgi:potassium efflux system protein
LPLTHAVHVALEKALRDNGIEIPFPQRDLHLRSVSPDAGGFLRGGERPEGEPGF